MSALRIVSRESSVTCCVHKSAFLRAFTKPMFLAFSRKHWRQISRAYLRMIPLLLPHTRLRRDVQRMLSPASASSVMGASWRPHAARK